MPSRVNPLSRFIRFTFSRRLYVSSSAHLHGVVFRNPCSALFSKTEFARSRTAHKRGIVQKTTLVYSRKEGAHANNGRRRAISCEPRGAKVNRFSLLFGILSYFFFSSCFSVHCARVRTLVKRTRPLTFPVVLQSRSCVVAITVEGRAYSAHTHTHPFHPAQP